MVSTISIVAGVLILGFILGVLFAWDQAYKEGRKVGDQLWAYQKSHLESRVTNATTLLEQANDQLEKTSKALKRAIKRPVELGPYAVQNPTCKIIPFPKKHPK